MATRAYITRLTVTEPASRYSHTAISHRFSALNGALAAFVEAERDLETVDCFDIAFLDWLRGAEQSRTAVLDGCAAIVTSRPERLEDAPLKRMAKLTRCLIESGSASEFLRLYNLLQSHAGLFSCPQRGPVGARVQQMLSTAEGHLRALDELGEFRDPLAPLAEAPDSSDEPASMMPVFAL